MGTARRTCWAAPVQSDKVTGMWRAIHGWLGLVVARYLFRRRPLEVDLDRLRSAGL